MAEIFKFYCAERVASAGKQHHHMESFDDLDLEQAPQEWQILPAPSLLPYGAISSVKLAWNPAGNSPQKDSLACH